MAEREPLTEAEQADLVAFLDGELKGEAARAVEAKVNLDPRWRAEASSHRQAWDLLDYLPRAEPKPGFAEKTLSRLAPLRQDDALPRRRLWPWACGMAAAALAGYLACRAMMPARPGERELLRDLRLIENKRAYQRIDDIDFLEHLAHPDLFGE